MTPARFFSRRNLTLMLTLTILMGCNRSATQSETDNQSETDGFLPTFVAFKAYDKNPLFTGTGADTWDEKIRERGYILKEADGYHLWYTGYREATGDEQKSLGYATSPDGIVWTRYNGNPIFTESWVEDMMVVRHDSLYYMFAEGRSDIAHMLTSSDKINWTDHGSLHIKRTNGEPLSAGAYGTPTVYIEGDVWHLFYERDDLGIWHATSTDLKEWRNVQDEPVIKMGPQEYDKYGVALNQIVRHGDYFYAYYHGTPTEDWTEWNTDVAVSRDLNTWTKYPENPILRDNKSSGILIYDGSRYRLYTMHDQMHLHFPIE